MLRYVDRFSFDAAEGGKYGVREGTEASRPVPSLATVGFSTTGSIRTKLHQDFGNVFTIYLSIVVSVHYLEALAHVAELCWVEL